MSTPIAFTAMNTAATTDSADMPHVLGDPADTLWDGTAERANNNFAAITAWCQAQSDAINKLRIPSAQASGATVATPATNWLMDYAYAYTLEFYGGVKLVFLLLNPNYNGPVVDVDSELPAQQMATLAVPYRPTIDTYYRIAGQYYCHGASVTDYQIQCDIGILTTGAVWLYNTSSPRGTAQKPIDITFTAQYFTGSS